MVINLIHLNTFGTPINTKAVIDFSGLILESFVLIGNIDYSFKC